jgi:hypothetical protein
MILRNSELKLKGKKTHNQINVVKDTTNIYSHINKLQQSIGEYLKKIYQ